MRHTWTDDDDTALYYAVEACTPLRDVMQGQPRQVWWAAVVGRLGLPDVSPDAARSRWDRLQRAATPEVALDVWEATARQVEEYEATVLEQARDGVDVLLERMGHLEGLVAELLAEWRS